MLSVGHHNHSCTSPPCMDSLRPVASASSQTRGWLHSNRQRVSVLLLPQHATHFCLVYPMHPLRVLTAPYVPVLRAKEANVFAPKTKKRRTETIVQHSPHHRSGILCYFGRPAFGRRYFGWRSDKRGGESRSEAATDT